MRWMAPRTEEFAAHRRRHVRVEPGVAVAVAVGSVCSNCVCYQGWMDGLERLAAEGIIEFGLEADCLVLGRAGSVRD